MSAADVLNAARERGVRIATAESCTGGMIAAALTAIPGASDVFDRGFVTYSNEAKQDMLSVSMATLDRFGAVSEEVALEMAAGAGQRASGAVAISVTGIAGPGGSEHKPEGRVCFGLAIPGQPPQSETVDFGPLGRDQVREATLRHALGILAAALSSEPH